MAVGPPYSVKPAHPDKAFVSTLLIGVQFNAEAAVCKTVTSGANCFCVKPVAAGKSAMANSKPKHTGLAEAESDVYAPLVRSEMETLL